jgi:hypothetical protein
VGAPTQNCLLFNFWLNRAKFDRACECPAQMVQHVLDELHRITGSRALHPRDTRHPIPDFFGEIRVSTRYPKPEIP